MPRDWRDDAACLGTDLGWFFPIGETGVGADQRFEAKRVCAACPVRESCLDFAMQTGITDGMFGGLDARERRDLNLRRRRRRPIERSSPPFATSPAATTPAAPRRAATTPDEDTAE